MSKFLVVREKNDLQNLVARQGILGIKVRSLRAPVARIRDPEYQTVMCHDEEEKLELFAKVFFNEGTGPLNDEEHGEYLDHHLRGATIREAVTYWKALEKRMACMSRTTLRYQDLEKECNDAKRYLHLARRFQNHGTDTLNEYMEQVSQKTADLIANIDL